MKKFRNVNVFLIKSDSVAQVGSIFKTKKLDSFHIPGIDTEVGQLVVNKNSHVIASNEYCDHYKMYVTTEEGNFRKGDWLVVKFITSNQHEENPCFEYKLIQIGNIENGIIYNKENNFKIDMQNENNFFQKIIATDDEALTFDEESSVYIRMGLTSYPKPTESFIHTFVKKYNENSLGEVVVEYNESVCKCDTFEKTMTCCYNVGDIDGTCSAPNPNKDFYGLSPKFKDGYVNIKFPGDSLRELMKSNPDLREEIVELLYDHTEFMLSGKKLTLEEWIEEKF